MIKTIVFYNGSEKEGRKKFKFLYDISESPHSTYIVFTKGPLEPIGEQSGEIPYVELNTQFVRLLTSVDPF
jgi:hypothetical protein